MIFDHNVLAFNEACFVQTTAESGHEVLKINERCVSEESNDRHRRLLRARRERPHRRAAEQRDELASPHSITSSASCWNDSVIFNPRDLAVFRLTTSSNLVGCIIGSSAGLAPLSIRLT